MLFVLIINKAVSDAFNVQQETDQFPEFSDIYDRVKQDWISTCTNIDLLINSSVLDTRTTLGEEVMNFNISPKDVELAIDEIDGRKGNNETLTVLTCFKISS